MYIVFTTPLALGLVTQVCIDSTYLDRIGSKLKGELKQELISFLKENKHILSSSAADMTGISLDIIFHELNVDPTFKPVKQKRKIWD